MLTKGMCADWGPYGVQVNGLGPGYIETELTRPLVEDEEFSAWVAGALRPAAGAVREDPVGGLLLLASSAADFVGGQILYRRRRHDERPVNPARDPFVPLAPRRTASMLGCVIHGAGDLRVEELPVPAPAPARRWSPSATAACAAPDLHYWRHGGVGDFRLKEPMLLGHEVVGTVGIRPPDTDRGRAGPGRQYGRRRAPGDPVRGVPGVRGRAGATAAGTPATRAALPGPCTSRAVSRRGSSSQPNSCAPCPPASTRAGPPSRSLSPSPLHAVRRAGDLTGRHLLVTGAGPIGCLVVAAAKAAGAAHVTVTDPLPAALEYARAAGADSLVLADAPEDAGWPAGVDTAIEASGWPRGWTPACDWSGAAVSSCSSACCRRGRAPSPGTWW